jgi:hypothetical protein
MSTSPARNAFTSLLLSVIGMKTTLETVAFFPQ